MKLTPEDIALIRKMTEKGFDDAWQEIFWNITESGQLSIEAEFVLSNQTDEIHEEFTELIESVMADKVREMYNRPEGM